MLSCKKCGKSNPPNRLKCFYCAEPLEVLVEKVGTTKLNLRELENWENGYNLIYLPQPDRPNIDIAEASRLLSLAPEFVNRVLSSPSPVPIIRIERAESEIIQNKLAELGIRCTIVPDERLTSEKMPIRLRNLKFEGDSILAFDFNSNRQLELGRDDLALIVVGAIFESETATTEKRKKKETKILDQIETSSDEMVIDIYTRSDSTGLRIRVSGFDFSCLGEGKNLIAAENMKRLLSELRGFAPGATVVDDYRQKREVLDEIWEIERRKDFLGPQRLGFGRDFGKIASSNNVQQFTKYSRLQWHLL